MHAMHMLGAVTPHPLPGSPIGSILAAVATFIGVNAAMWLIGHLTGRRLRRCQRSLDRPPVPLIDLTAERCRRRQSS